MLSKNQNPYYMDIILIWKNLLVEFNLDLQVKQLWTVVRKKTLSQAANYFTVCQPEYDIVTMIYDIVIWFD